ncbi:hypothetical protein BV25DRAFT_1320233 [Artomyces pyxidatus]|uniref:Uncharacterized protein n=1 Tax=Artomyces pyxidatus TaxID=48021 RepID=A0ACB8SN82_9AGAM|nr:hypothetical protein BV25DRAFT_1320233 [Artomyces pyxidatus]
MLSSMYSALAFVPLSTVCQREQLTDLQGRLELVEANSGGNVNHVHLLRKWLSNPRLASIEIIQMPNFFSTTSDLKPKENSHYQTIMTTFLHVSRGSVHIASSDPLAPPEIDPGYLKDPINLDALLSAVGFMQKVLSSEPFRSAASGISACDPPNAVQSDEAIREWCRLRVEPLAHPVASAPMFPKEDGGVVDATLKVYGTKNLRVVDASILPFELSCHIQSTVYAIAQKAADIIKASCVKY